MLRTNTTILQTTVKIFKYHCRLYKVNRGLIRSHGPVHVATFPRPFNKQHIGLPSALFCSPSHYHYLALPDNSGDLELRLRCSATNRAVPGSIPGGVTGEIFRGTPDRTMCPEFDSASESIRDLSWGKGGRWV